MNLEEFNGRKPGFPAEIWHVGYVAEDQSSKATVVRLPQALRARAIRLTEPAGSADSELLSAGRLELMQMDGNGLAEGSELANEVQAWVDEKLDEGHGVASQWIMMQNALVVAGGERFAVVADQDRLPKIRQALLSGIYVDRCLERTGNDGCRTVGDLGSECRPGRSADRCRRQCGPLTELLQIQIKLQQLAPFVYQEHVYPPTVASQVAERFRERRRLEHRHEILCEQLEPFERALEMRRQRASDVQLAQSSNKLEWVIILLLIAQLLLSLFEIMGGTAST